MSYSNYVIYYSNIDSSQQINLTKLEVKLNEIENDFVFVDINSAIEFSEIKRYIDNNIYPKSWTDYDIKYYKEKINKIEQIIKPYGIDLYIFFNRILAKTQKNEQK